MQYEKKIIEIGGSQGVILPLDLLNYLGIKVGDRITIEDDTGKHGKFVAFWKSHNMTNEQIKKELEKKM